MIGMSYIQDVENELKELAEELEEQSKTNQGLLNTASRKIENYIGDYGAENWSEDFNDGFKAGYDLALSKGKLDKTVTAYDDIIDATRLAMLHFKSRQQEQSE